MAMPRFDFTLNLETISDDVPLQDSGQKSAKDKDAKRLARCGKCNNCKSQDCGSCYNCADKPKFGGPGIKKQACINRKCLLMVPRDEEGEKIARKRSKQRSGPAGAIDPRTGGVGKPFAMPSGFGTQSFSSGPTSPPSSPDADWADERDSLDGRDSPLEMMEPTGFNFARNGAAPTRMDPVEPATNGLTLAQNGLTPYFSGGTGTAADELPALFGDNLGFLREANAEYSFGLDKADPLPVRREVSEFAKMFGEKINALAPQRDVQRDWSWNNPLLLQEEFILMNDLHRRESAMPNYPIAAF